MFVCVGLVVSRAGGTLTAARAASCPCAVRHHCLYCSARASLCSATLLPPLLRTCVPVLYYLLPLMLCTCISVLCHPSYCSAALAAHSATQSASFPYSQFKCTHTLTHTCTPRLSSLKPPPLPTTTPFSVSTSPKRVQPSSFFLRTFILTA